ncbi:MAG TPA: OmpA family protein [Steroidobacteraceae bacterium]|jgi:outer membrane protein OmpA-like peptidoglycan-associated protein|nr:OmpA family protein [Steroidobacteraceae bacterium]
MNSKLLTGMGLALALCACASAPRPNAALESAHAAVRSAESDPNVNKYAALDLDMARKQLAIADDAALHHDDAAVDQPAYLAAQNARLAEARATAKADDARVAAGQGERDSIVLASRTREVDSAKMAANVAREQRDEATGEAARAQVDAARSQMDAARSQMDATRSQDEAARLQAEVDSLKAKPTPRGLVLTLGDVLFDTGRAELNPGAGRKLDQLAQFLNEHKDRRVQIDGFTDSVGTDSYNEELSHRRADSVKSALLMRGVDSSRISTEGYGKAFPVANNVDSGGRQLNRRVEVIIGADDGRAISPRG